MNGGAAPRPAEPRSVAPRPEAAPRRAAPPRPSLLIPGLLALAAFLALVALGTWQVERKAWKEGLIAALDERLAAPPMALPPRETWSGLDPVQAEFRRVSFTAELLPAQEALVYTGGSSLRTDVSGPGYWVFSPARLKDGSVVVVNRGFVPEGRQDPKTRPGGEVSGQVELTGALRWPEARGMFTPADEPARNLWFVRDHLAMAAAKGWGAVGPATGTVAPMGTAAPEGAAVAPFFIEQEAPSPPGGLPVVGRMHPHLPNDHLQYAITWYGLSVVMLVMFSLWARSRS